MRLPVLIVALAGLTLATAAGATGPFDGTYAGTSLRATGTTTGGNKTKAPTIVESLAHRIPASAAKNMGDILG